MNNFPSFIKWGNFKSHDAENPDILELQVADDETFETMYSINARVNYKENNGEWVEAVLPLKSHESNNAILLQEWQKAKDKGLTKNSHFKLKTWLGQTKTSLRQIRRFILEA